MTDRIQAFVRSARCFAITAVFSCLAGCTHPMIQPHEFVSGTLVPQPMVNAPSPVFASVNVPARPAAHVMMVQWMSPLHWRDYTTEWNLLFLQQLAKANHNDPYNDPPGKVVRMIIGKGKAWRPLQELLTEILLPSEAKVLDDRRWFYTVTGRQPRWFDQHVFLGVPSRLMGTSLDDDFWSDIVPFAFPGATRRAPDPLQADWLRREQARGNTLTPEWMSRWLSAEIWGIGEGRDRSFNPTGAVPSVHTDAGDRAVSFTSFARALAFLQAHPEKPVWVMAADAPDHPAKIKVPSENALWFVLTHPGYNTHPFPRKPLAVLYAPQKTEVDPQKTRANAFKIAIGDALDAAAVKPADIGRFFHDAGTNAPPGTGIAAMAQAITELDPGNEWFPRAYDVDRYLQNAGAAAAAMNFALATAFTHHTGKPALVVATRERDAAYAMVVAPPPEHVVPAPKSEWPRARGGGGYLPWWGALIRR